MATLWPGRGGPVIDYISAPPPPGWQDERPRSLVILGSTGSIGRNAMAVVDANPGFFAIRGLACARNVRLLAEQAMQHRPACLAVLDEEAARELAALLPVNYRPKIVVGPEGYRFLAGMPEATTVLSAQVGAAGLAGTLAAAVAGKVICLANKESLVLAGTLVRDLCRRTGAVILPVDSEHNAIFQCLAGRGQDVNRLVLTASGGPFLGRSREELADVTPTEALCHPNWNMGAKVTIDSASLMNKGLEVIEAFHLYGVAPENIRVLVHPQSLVHSMVSLADGSQIAQMATADMRLPIAHCLCWPECLYVGVPWLDLVAAGPLSFHEPDIGTFPCLGLAWEALAGRGGRCVVLNAANEEAVDLFLQGRCGFADIPRLIRSALAAYEQLGTGHDPLCTPLAVESAAGTLELERQVAALAARISALDHNIRAMVRAMAQDGESKCF